MKNYTWYNNNAFNMPRILENYREYLSSEDKSKLNDILNKKSHKILWKESITVKQYWESMLEMHASDLKDKKAALRIFYDNSKNVQSQYLGGGG